jgi:hypothetical protein
MVGICMSAIGTTLFLSSLLAACALAAAITAGVRRRWRRAAVVARAVVLGGPALLLLAGGAVVARATGSDAMAKAAPLASGIAELMNGGVLLLFPVLACAVVWALARRRLRCTEGDSAGKP